MSNFSLWTSALACAAALTSTSSTSGVVEEAGVGVELAEERADIFALDFLWGFVACFLERGRRREGLKRVRMGRDNR